MDNILQAVLQQMDQEQPKHSLNHDEQIMVLRNEYKNNELSPEDIKEGDIVYIKNSGRLRDRDDTPMLVTRIFDTPAFTEDSGWLDCELISVSKSGRVSGSTMKRFHLTKTKPETA